MIIVHENNGEKPFIPTEGITIRLNTQSGEPENVPRYGDIKLEDAGYGDLYIREYMSDNKWSGPIVMTNEQVNDFIEVFKKFQMSGG